jgi:hypothetical protein
MKHRSGLIRRGVAGAGVIALALLMPVWHGAVRTAQAQSFSPVNNGDNYYVSYYDVATNNTASAGGYGGPGSSGGSGDGTVRIVNPTSNDTIQSGTLCAMIYVFDDIEELQACCGCPVTPDGMRTYSVINDLTKNFGVNRGNMNAGVIKLISSTINFTPVPQVATPRGVTCTTGTAGCCDPTGGNLNGQNKGTGTPVDPTSALRAWMTHTESQVMSAPPFGVISSASAEEFKSAPLDSTELSTLQASCGQLIQNGSGAGTCNCGAGESNTRPGV